VNTPPTVANPTLASDGARFGIAVTQVDYPTGSAGVRMSLDQMARRIIDGMRSMSMRQFAEFVVRQAGVPPSAALTHRQAAQVFLDYVRANVRYRPDPANTELTQIAAVTLCVPGAAICIPVEDCDGLAVALLTLCGAYGMNVKILHQVFGSSDQEHVLGLIQDDNGDWLPVDPCGPVDKPVGWKASATHENVIDPLDPATIQRVGAREAEFIGIGGFAAHRRRVARSVGRFVGQGVGATGMGLVPIDSVTELDQQIDPQMDSLNSAVVTCAALSPSDTAAWGGIYASWKTLHTRWQSFVNAPWYSALADIFAAAWAASDTLVQMQGYAATLKTWQGKVQSACSGYVAPPTAIVQPPAPTPGTATNDITKAVGAITGIIVAGTVAYVVVESVGWLNVLKPRAANPVKRRHRRR
jgi:hypothetical protein